MYVLKNQNIIKFAIACGSLSILGTMSIVVLSVIGRHIRVPLPGSIEIVELLIVVVASISILYATIIGSHASARLFIDRLSPGSKLAVERLAYILGAIFLLALIIGNIWIIVDYWALHEASHLLEIPIIPFRILFVVSLTLAAFFLLKRLFTNSNTENTLDFKNDD